MSAMALTVDGETIADLASYRVLIDYSGCGFPRRNLLGSEQTIAESVADGYQVMLSPLSPGEHEVGHDHSRITRTAGHAHVYLDRRIRQQR